MINKLVLENLKHRWVRTLLSALVVSVQVMSILTLIGISRGMLQDAATRARGAGADIFLRPDSLGSFQLASGQIPEKFVDVVARQPHVKQAIAMLSAPVTFPTTMNGLDIPAFQRMTGGLHFVKGGPPLAADDVLIDDYYATQNKLHVGDQTRLLNHQWRVCGIVEAGVLSRLIVQIHSLQYLTGNSDPARISNILVKVDDRANVTATVNQLNTLLKGQLRALSIDEMVSLYSVNNVPALRAFITVVTALSVIVGFLVVFLSMYTAVVERTREIGILKALGAKPGTVVDILVREAIVLAVSGAVLGIALSFGTRALIMALVPASLQAVNAPDWWPIAGAIAIGGALLGAIYPGWKAARQDAIEALSYE